MYSSFLVDTMILVIFFADKGYKRLIISKKIAQHWSGCLINPLFEAPRTDTAHILWRISWDSI